jgi:transposase-like protein
MASSMQNHFNGDDIRDWDGWRDICRGMNLQSIPRLFPDSNRPEQVRLLTILKLIPSRDDGPACSKCGFQSMGALNDADNPTGFRFACWSRNRRTGRQCTHRVSPLENTIFEGTKVNFTSTISLAYCFINDMPVTKAAYECSVSEVTAVHVFQLFRNVCGYVVKVQNFQKIGGDGKKVEVDETHVAVRKYHRGRELVSEHYWVVGGTCRESKKVFMTPVLDRTRQTIYQVLEEYVEVGSVMYTDDWRAYRGLEALGFAEHNVVVHKWYFVDPDDRDIHTQNVERLWRELKDHIKYYEFEWIITYVEFYMYKHNELKYGMNGQPLNLSGGEKLAIFLEHCADMYPGPGQQRPDPLGRPVPVQRGPRPQQHPHQVAKDEAQSLLRELLFKKKYRDADDVEQYLNAKSNQIDALIALVRGLQPHVMDGTEPLDANVEPLVHPAFGEHFAVLRTAGGGDCFYNSVSLTISGNESFMPILRILALHFLVKYRPQFEAIVNNIPGLTFREVLLGVGTTSNLRNHAHRLYPGLPIDFNWADTVSEAATCIAIQMNIAIYGSFIDPNTADFVFPQHTSDDLEAEFVDDVFNLLSGNPLTLGTHVTVCPAHYPTNVKVFLNGGHFSGIMPRTNNVPNFDPARKSDIVNLNLQLGD